MQLTIGKRGKTGKRLLGVAVGVLGVALLAGACGSSGSGKGKSGGKSLAIVNASGAEWVCNYNSFNPAANVDTNLVYEPLYVINDLDDSETPWLTTAYKWAPDNMSVTFDVRKGVNWTDGKPFTAKDIAFTFNYEKEHAELDGSALWSGNILDSVETQGEDKVVFKLKRVSTTSLRYIMGTRIRPEHVWSPIKDPVKVETKEAVGTGPYAIKSCNPQSITYVKNDKYWQEGKPKVEKIVYPAFKDNGPANRFLAQGKGDWGGQFVPDIESYWIKKDPEHRKIWYPAMSNVTVTVNMTNKTLGNKLVRQALAYAIDRDEVSKKGMYGYQKPASQTAVVDTMAAKWRDEDAAAKYDYKYDCAKAQAKLTEAGFKKGSDGMFQTADGKPFKPELINNSGFTDWVASVKFIGESAKKCGIDLQVSNLAGQVFDDRREKGQFELAYDAQGSGSTPYFELRNFLYSKLTQPIGTATGTNRGRFKDPKVDALLESYDKTTDEAEQTRIVKELQGIILEEVPVIPVTQNVSWAQFDTTRFTGWPSEKDPYAVPAPYATNWEVVLLKLEPVK